MLAVTNTALINMIMASRLVYGMANERIVPSAFGTVHPGRRTPVIAILFTTALAVILVSTGDPEGLADTTVLLLLVFAVGGHEGAVYLRALILLVLGAVLWLINRVVVGKVEQVDPARFDG